jgi:capsular polysaccharide biosynthesis protein
MNEPGLLPLLRRWWSLLALSAVAAAAIAWPITSGLSKTYEAEMKFLVGPVNADYATLEAAGALSRTYADLAQSRRMVEAAARASELTLTRRQVETAVSATSNDVTRIIDVRVRYSDPKSAARLAGALATQLFQLREQAPKPEVDPVAAIMADPRVAKLSARERRDVRHAALRVVGQAHAGDLRLIDAPVPPPDPVAPMVGLLIVLAAIVGALAAAAYVIVREGASARSAAAVPLEDFEIETILPSENGAEAETRGDLVDRLLHGTGRRERP